MNKLIMIVVFILISYFISCRDSVDQSTIEESSKFSKTVHIKLIDSLGELTLDIPQWYDTLYSWVDQSDCGKPCDEQKYRYQSKSFPIVKESGFMWTESTMDSVDRLTISHSSYFPFNNGDSSIIKRDHSHFKEKILSEAIDEKLIFDTVQKIGDRYFSIVAVGKSDTIFTRKVFATTTIKRNTIQFKYEKLAKHIDSLNDNFVAKSRGLIKTIRINLGM